MRRPGLGFYGPLIVATGGPSNPVGLAVTIGLGVASVISKFLPIGAGRREADYLTDPETGAQSHVGAALAQIIDGFNARPDLWTVDGIASAIAAVEKIRDDFFSYTQQFLMAGPGARRTIAAVTDQLITDLRRIQPPTSTERETGMQPTRLYIIEPNGLIDTGRADYADATGRQFANEYDLNKYAFENGERLFRVYSADEAVGIQSGRLPFPAGWAAIDPHAGQVAPTPGDGPGLGVLATAAGVLYYLFG